MDTLEKESFPLDAFVSEIKKAVDAIPSEQLKQNIISYASELPQRVVWNFSKSYLLKISEILKRVISSLKKIYNSLRMLKPSIKISVWEFIIIP